MWARKLHKWLGILMLLPLFAWTITGAIFLVKPGYQQAYEQLSIKTYPMTQAVVIKPQAHWQEYRYLNTILGGHLLVKINEQWLHLRPATQRPYKPTLGQIKTLLADAIKRKPDRYGAIQSIDDYQATTTTEVELQLNWRQLTLIQSGLDTRQINQFYKIHYLQWTGNASLDKALGILGLLLLLGLSYVGLRLVLRP